MINLHLCAEEDQYRKSDVILTRWELLQGLVTVTQ
jgi:hypothetical protein